jgi:hypothetical protein
VRDLTLLVPEVCPILFISWCRTKAFHSLLSVKQAMMDHNPRNLGLGDLAVLPDELLEHIFLAPALDVHDLIALSMASHVLQVLCLEEPVWMKFHLLGGRPRLQYEVCSGFLTSLKNP